MRKRTWRKWAACALTAGLVLQNVGAVGFADEAVFYDETAFDEAGYAEGDTFADEAAVIYDEAADTADFYDEDYSWDTEGAAEDADFYADWEDGSDDGVTYGEDASEEADYVTEDFGGETLVEAVQVESIDDPEPAVAEEPALLAVDGDAIVLPEEVVDVETANVPDAPDNSEELFEKLAEIELYGEVQGEEGAEDATFSSASEGANFMAVDYLKGANKDIYEALLPLLRNVSGGSATSTVFEIPSKQADYEKLTATASELGVDWIYNADTKTINSEAKTAIQKLYLSRYKDESCTANVILSAVLADLPYDLYWFDKTVGLKASKKASFSASSTQLTITYTSYTISFAVAKDYAASEEYTVDQSSREALNKANENIKQILSKFSALNDYDKLFAYCNEICSMVTYNSEAASGSISGKVSYGNPWQLIWVFDGDSTTNVVCEGYAKAFQYLAQMSTFNYKDLEVRGVNGFRNKDKTAASKHMWNIVRMDDGVNYIVDPTNCDAGSSANKRVFLVGAKGSVSEGYTCANSSSPYVYNDSSLRAYSTADLTVAGYDYGHEHIEVVLPGKAASCTEEGLTEGIVCSVCGTVIKEQKTIAPSHSVIAVMGKAATCTEKGLSTGLKCVNCGTVLKEQKEIPAKGHTEDEGTVTKQPTALAEGVRTFKCTVCGKVLRTEAEPKLEAVLELSKEALSMKASDKKTVTATVARGDSIESVSSSDKTIAKAAKNKLTITIYSGKKVGKATIKVKLKSGLTKNIAVTVVDKVVDITGLASSLKIKKGSKLQLNPKLVPTNSTKKITYKTSDKSVATVSAAGLITGKKKGKATITVTAGAVSKKVSVTVTA